MSLEISGPIDRKTIPEAMLPLAKEQMRVLTATQDDFITGLIVRTIDVFERQSGLSIFAITALWTPDDFDSYTAGKGVVVPLQPLIGWTASDGTDDVSANYRIVGNKTGRATGLYLQSITPVWPLPYGGMPTAIVTLNAGCATLDDIQPGALQAILERVATLFLWREDLSEDTVHDMPASDQTWIVGNWVPRA